MTAGRPPIYTEDLRVCLKAEGKTTLHTDSDRRAVVMLLLDNNGCMTLGAINAQFGREMKKTISAMLRTGWLTTGESDGQAIHAGQ